MTQEPERYAHSFREFYLWLLASLFGGFIGFLLTHAWLLRHGCLQ